MIKYFEEKIWPILFYILFIFIQLVFSYLLGFEMSVILLLFLLSVLLLIIYLSIDYRNVKKQSLKIKLLTDNLEEKYLIAEVLKKPKDIKGEAYYYALKKASKSMNDEISKLEHKYEDYKEYIESFVHEVKTPIAALLLYSDNHKDSELKGEVQKIDNLVEQVLYYARSENPEKDYFIKVVKLSEIIHQVLMQNKDYFLKHRIFIETNNLDIKVATDEKWIIFVINQTLNNSIKYMEKEKKAISFQAREEDNKVILEIVDNGIGIKESDLTKIFEKGFTGSDRKKSRSTGMGLYLAKKICDKLGLNIMAESEYNEWTKIIIEFPKSNFNKIDELNEKRKK